jgi:uncharacterized membrane protein YidH (DUF202 family)
MSHLGPESGGWRGARTARSLHYVRPGGVVVKLIGIVLIALGVIGLVFGGISWTRDKTVLDAGPLEVKTEQRESIPLTPIASGIALVAGAALVLGGARRP